MVIISIIPTFRTHGNSIIIGSLRTITHSISSNIIIKSMSHQQPKLSQDELINGCKLGIDTHADSSCAGKHVRILEYIDGKTYTVSPFLNSYTPTSNISMINGVIAVDKDDGTGYILELNNFLNFSDSMNDSILVPMQARQNGIVIDDVPKDLCYHGVSTQSVFVPEKNISIPIEFNGPIPYIKVRYPTDRDLDEYEWVQITSSAEWNPYDQVNISSVSSSESPPNYDYDLRTQLYHDLIENTVISAVNVTSVDSSLSSEALSKLWRIPLSHAKRTLQVTTNNYARTTEGRLSRRFRTDLYQKRYRRMGGWYSRFYTDTLFFKTRTADQFTCAQLFGNRARFCKIYPLPSKSKAFEALSSFVHDIGIPGELHSDGAKEIAQGIFRKMMTKFGIFHTSTEPYSPWENYAEDCIRVLKNNARYFMQITQTPIRLLDHALMYACELRNMTASPSVFLKGRTPFEITLGYSPDISEFTTFEWYEFVWYWDPDKPQKQMLGRWLGVTEHIGNGLTYKVINSNAEILSRSTVIKLSAEDKSKDDMKRKMASLNDSIKLKLGTYEKANLDDVVPEQSEVYRYLFEGDDDPHPKENAELMEESVIPDADDNAYHEALSEELNDRYLGVNVLLPQDGKLQEAKVVSRKRTNDGKMLVGRGHFSPVLDSRVYNVEFPDGGTGEFTTNTIAEALYSNVDDDGYNFYGLLDGIIAHRKLSEAIDKDKGFYTQNGVRKRVVTTKGWDIRLKWADGSTTWLPLKEVKSSNPLELAEYAIANKINEEPAFAWWIPTVLRTRKRMISRLKTHHKIRKRSKFGVSIPETLEEARKMDLENGNNLWEVATKKEIDKVKVAFALQDDGTPDPVGSKLINYHLIYDVKMDLTRKARLVAGGHLNKDVPKHITYSSVVSKESVRICFTLAALNNLDILSGDIGNAYLNARPREKCHVKITDDLLFGPSAIGKTAIIVRALYGMKSSGAAWRDTISSFLKYDMKFNMCLADNDIWFKADTKEDGSEYYTYICIYVDDILICSENPKKYMNDLGAAFMLKSNSVGEPNVYLGADFRKKQTADGSTIWITGANSYLKEALRIYNGISIKTGVKIQGSARTPFSNQTYRAELDLSPFCNDDQIHIYQQLIGILRWIIELGRVDIQLETTKLSSYLASPRSGHLYQAMHIFEYLKHHCNSWIPLDPNQLDVKFNGPPDETPELRRETMKKIYQDASEDLPSNAPEPRGESVQVNVYSDSDHAGDKVTRRSQTGILIFINMSLVYWFSKRQNTVESSTFGSEYIAVRIAIEKIKALRYKLRMMGVPMEGPANLFVDNESVVKASMNPESTLSKKHVSIAYHLTRESFAAGIVSIYFINSKDNLSDLLTKVLPYRDRRDIFQCIFW